MNILFLRMAWLLFAAWPFLRRGPRIQPSLMMSTMLCRTKKFSRLKLPRRSCGVLSGRWRLPAI